jgi:hypothetical protein
MRCVSLLLVAILLFADCDTVSHGYHHDRNSGTQSVVYFQIPDWHDGFENPVRKGINGWGASTRLAVRFVRTCPASPANCVKVTTVNLPNGWAGLTYMSIDQHKHITARFELDRDLIYSSPATVQQVACHEAGHAVGLDHGVAGSTGPPCSGGVPTWMDMDLVTKAHAHIDSCCTPGV